MVAPVIADLPPAPQRQQAKADFSATANTHVAALPVFVTETNTQATFNDTQATNSENSATNASASENAASTSATNALTSETNAAISKNSAQVAAAAAQSSAGLPSLIGNSGRSLKVTADELNVEWGETELTGDIQFSADATTHAAPAWLDADGSLYNTTTYADLFDILGDFPVKLANPAAAYQNGFSCEYSDNGVYLAVGSQNSQFLRIYKKAGDVLTLLANPTGGMPAASVRSVSWGANDTYLAVTQGSTSPSVKIYKRTGDAFAKLPDVSTAGINGNACDFSPDGVYLTVVGDNGDGIITFKRSGDTFTPLSSPSSLPAAFSSAKDIRWSRSGIYLAISNGVAPYLDLYKRSGDLLTKMANPSSLPTGGDGIDWGLNDDFLTFAHPITPFVTTYSRSVDAFTKIADLTDLPHGNCASCSYSDSGRYLALAVATTPFLLMYEQISGVFTKMSPPLASTAGQAFYVDFGDSDGYVSVAHLSTPYVSNYSFNSNLPDIDTGDAITPTLAYIKTGL